MIKQLKQVDHVEEANELLDKGWVLLSSNNSTFILGAKEEVWEKEKQPKMVGRHR